IIIMCMNNVDKIIIDIIPIFFFNHKMEYNKYEANVDEKQVILAGIVGNGYILTQMLAEQLETISPLRVILCEVSINKKEPREEITTSIPVSEYKNQSLVLIDDVLHTGF